MWMFLAGYCSSWRLFSGPKMLLSLSPSCFHFQTMLFFCEGCIFTTETIFHCSGWHGTPAAYVLCWTPIQHKDFSCSHFYKLMDAERQTMIVMMFITLRSFFFFFLLTIFLVFLLATHLSFSQPLGCSKTHHVKKPDEMAIQSRANKTGDKPW